MREGLSNKNDRTTSFFGTTPSEVPFLDPGVGGPGPPPEVGCRSSVDSRSQCVGVLTHCRSQCGVVFI